MHRALVLVLVAAALTSGFAAAATGRSTSKPVLKLVQRSPFQVQGLRFKARERVRLTASTDTERVTRTARTTRRGKFTADFGAVDVCKRVTVKAVGTRGDRATLVVEPPTPPGADRACWGL
jgi:hypothetical protein